MLPFEFRQPVKEAERILSTTRPISRCPFCRQYDCNCPDRIREDVATTNSTYENDEDEEEDDDEKDGKKRKRPPGYYIDKNGNEYLVMSGEKDEVVINPPINMPVMRL